MTDSPIVQIVASRRGVQEVAVVSHGNGEEDVRLYQAMLPAVELINQAVRALTDSVSTSK